MENPNYKGLEFIGGFSMLAGVLWLVGALLVGILVMMGTARLGDGSVSPAANQTEAAESSQTQ